MIRKVSTKKKTVSKKSKKRVVKKGKITEHLLYKEAKKLIHGETTIKELQKKYKAEAFKSILSLSENIKPDVLNKGLIPSPYEQKNDSIHNKLISLIRDEIAWEASQLNIIMRDYFSDNFWLWNKTVELHKDNKQEFRCLVSVLPAFYGEVVKHLGKASKILERSNIQFKFSLSKNIIDPLMPTIVIGYLEIPKYTPQDHITEYQALIDSFLTKIPKHALTEINYHHLN